MNELMRQFRVIFYRVPGFEKVDHRVFFSQEATAEAAVEHIFNGESSSVSLFAFESCRSGRCGNETASSGASRRRRSKKPAEPHGGRTILPKSLSIRSSTGPSTQFVAIV